MDIRTFLQQNRVYLDGGTGTLLQERGLPLGELPERWNVANAEALVEIHRAYFDAGSNVVATNTFGANRFKFSAEELEVLVKAAIENAKRAAETSVGTQPKFVALDIGPTGKLLRPYGELDFEDAVACFAETVKLGTKYGADLILIETMSDCYETKAALLAAKENCDLPVLVSCAYGADGKLMTGASPAAMTALLEGMGADGIGVNCSLGPKQLGGVVEALLKKSSLPVLVKPNAGLPCVKDGKTCYDIDEEEFASAMAEFARMGARILGGCCGTTPAYIRALVEKTKDLPLLPIEKKEITCVSSYTHAVEFDLPVLIGERINPTGKKRFKQALLEGDDEYVLREGLAQQEKGAHILDVNVGMPEIDEKMRLPAYVEKLQAVLDLPLQIDTSDVVAMERALRRYNGKALINSVNGKAESMATVFPLVKKYGGVVVALTLDETGIPDTVEGRVAIAEKIVAEAAKYGIEKKDILIDPLAMAVSADKNAAAVTLRALREIKERLGVHTSLGVSNVSFGLPSRETINATFFARALENGLSAAILNPNSAEMLKVYYSFLCLEGKDENCGAYIRFVGEVLPTMGATTTSVAAVGASGGDNAIQNEKGADTPLQRAIVKGLDREAARICETLLNDTPALAVIEGEIVPALDHIGKEYEEKRAYLPQLLMSAEAAKAAFEKISERLACLGERQERKCKVVLATVQGDIHDIGKNIVKTLLENYGFDVLDLGRDVPPERIAEAVEKTGAPLVGLSALMTTTVPSMEKTIALLRERGAACKIIVGGAVLTEEYAEKIGADGYGKDGMATVRYALHLYEDLCKNQQDMQ
ncbi:MAG: homocysteine S-methyltransferase family protein [Clostridia bacterium]|nr:homocysteine S-methyltransferase family protein [Clostridia bacterium]